MKKILLGILCLFLFSKIAYAKTVYEEMRENAINDNTINIDYTQYGSKENGEGIFVVGDTINDENPILYYRGITNNYIRFNNFCGQIVRTTDTGGIKLAITGKLNDQNQCENFNLIGMYESAFDIGYMNSSFDDNYFRHYMLYPISYDFPKKYSFSYSYTYENGKYSLDNPQLYYKKMSLKGKYFCLYGDGDYCSEEGIYYFISEDYAIKLQNGINYDDDSLNIVYGNSVQYIDGKYKLVDTITSNIVNWNDEYLTISSRYHYTCFSNKDECEVVSYIYEANNRYCSIKKLNNDASIEEYLKNYFSMNDVDSHQKIMVDNWYKENMIEYTKYIEDTVYCNDRSISNYGFFNKDVNLSLAGSLEFSGYHRYYETKKPTLACANLEDRFTVSETIGNGKLTYPVGGLTIDELMYMGDERLYSTITSYLYTSSSSTTNLFSDLGEYTQHYPTEEGPLIDYIIPVISLKKGATIKKGDGTEDNPYIIEGVEKEEVPEKEETPKEEQNYDDETIENPQTANNIINNLFYIVILLFLLGTLLFLKRFYNKKIFKVEVRK